MPSYLQKANRMYSKFEKYWSEYSTILAIAVTLDPRYKIQFVDFCYSKLYGPGSTEGSRVWEKLTSLFGMYMNSVPAKGSMPCSSQQTSYERNAGSSFTYSVSDFTKECIDVMKVWLVNFLTLICSIVCLLVFTNFNSFIVLQGIWWVWESGVECHPTKNSTRVVFRRANGWYKVEAGQSELLQGQPVPLSQASTHDQWYPVYPGVNSSLRVCRFCWQ